MIGQTGENAGKIWEYLNRNGKVSAAGLAKGTGLKAKQVDRALGWLAREGKIRIEKSGNKEVVALQEMTSGAC